MPQILDIYPVVALQTVSVLVQVIQFTFMEANIESSKQEPQSDLHLTYIGDTDFQGFPPD